MLDHTILVELQEKGSDGLIYRTQDGRRIVINKIDYVMKVRDRIKIAAQIEVLEDIAVEYKGKTIDNIIQQLEARLSVLK